MHRWHAFSIGSLAILMLSVSCGGVQKAKVMFGDLLVVQSQLAKALGRDDIRVNLNNGHLLNIGVVNSPLNELPTEQKKAKAIEIARLAYNGYPSRYELTGVSVAFAVHRSYLGLFDYDDSTDSFNFEASDLTPEHKE